MNLSHKETIKSNNIKVQNRCYCHRCGLIGVNSKDFFNADIGADVTIGADADISADANIGAEASTIEDINLNILTYHKNIFIEMVKTFRENITISDIDSEIAMYKNELRPTIYKNLYLLKDFKYEIAMTLLPILQIIFINNDINKLLAESIIQEIKDIINNNDQLISLLLEFSIFLKILQPYIYMHQ